MVLEDSTEACAHRIEIRMTVPPRVSNLLPLRELEKVHEDHGVEIVGIMEEDEDAPPDPSILV